MTEVTLDDVALSDAVPAVIVKRVVRQLLGDRRDVFELVPGRAGSWLFGEQAGDRLITLELALVGEPSTYPIEESGLEARRAACRALADWADDPGLVKLVADDEPDRYSLAKLSSAPTPDEWLIRATVDLAFRASPYAFANDLSTASVSLAEGVADTSLELDDTVNAYPVLEITAGETMASGFVLNVNGLVLVYGDAVAADDVFTVSSLTYTVSTGANTDTELAGLFVVGDLSMGSVDGDFPILVPGENQVEIVGGDADVTITWRRRYR